MLLRGGDARPPDIPRFLTKALDHYRKQILGFIRHAGARPYRVTFRMGELRRALSLLQGPGAFHHQLTEVQYSKIGGAEMLARAIGDRALAVLHGGVLLGDALDPGVASGLLQLAIDQ